MKRRGPRPEFDHGQFWADLVEDLADPEFREAYTDMSLRFMQEFHERKLAEEKTLEHYGELHDTWEDCTGRKFYVHKRTVDCDIDGCAIHNPSYHPLSDAKQLMREDRGFLIERICDHGIGHPDPDSASFMAKSGYGLGIWIHGCDGCCRDDSEEPWDYDLPVSNGSGGGWGEHQHVYHWIDDDNGHCGSFCRCGKEEPF
ncbi:hypothetical protein SEA_ALONE_123 [Streptomyces phage Alone3]|nr:hypothetical protein SEA_ALONE_123 [Streptomyces phage Alone3]